jgi:long-chain acyl-CoA synthetase
MSDPQHIREAQTDQRHCIAAALRAAAAISTDKIAIRDADRSISHRQLCQRIDQVSSAAMNSLGLGPGDAVLLVASNCLEYVEIVAGLAQIGVLTATLTPRLNLREIEAIAKDCNAKAVIADEASADLLGELKLPLRRIGEDYEAWLEAAPSDLMPPALPANQPVLAPYTSGSTGQPKGVLLSGESRLALMRGSIETYRCFGQDDNFLAVSPLCYGGGLLYALTVLVAGGTCTIAREFDAEQTLKDMAGGQITGVFLVPTHFHQMLSLPAEILARYRSPGALRAIISNAAPLSDELRLRVLDYWGEGLLNETYGSTEAGVTSNLPPADQRRKKKCVGLPFPQIEMRIVDAAGHEVPVGEVGELLIRSPYRFNGYLNRPAETAEVVRGDWLAIGDLARRDDEGYYYIVGRAKDMILSGGINIYPKEIEDALTAHPSVSEASVVGFEDPQWGESVGAAVVLHAGQTLEAGDLAAHVRQTLAAYKTPRRVILLDALPKGPMGKVQKAEVRKIMAQARV